MATRIQVNIGLGNSLLPDSTKPYFNQCWLMISEVLWYSPDSNFTANTSDIYRWNEFEIY